MGRVQNGLYELKESLFGSQDSARVSTRYLASLFTAGDEEEIRLVNKKLLAIRMFKRAETVADVDRAEAAGMLDEARMTSEEAEAIYRMTSLPTFDERFVIPPMLREQAIESTEKPQSHKEEAGFGFSRPPKRGW